MEMYVDALARVSIQLMSPASGNNTASTYDSSHKGRVSIQLMSPASGNDGGFTLKIDHVLEFPFN